MRVTSIELYSDRLEENLKFSLNQSEPFEKYQIRTITGLDAEELIPRFYGFGRQPASVSEPSRQKFFEFSMKPREVSMRVVLNPNFTNNETYSDIRDELYRMISSTRTGEIFLQFNAGATAIAQLKGFVTKFEAGYFNALPEAQITVKCEDPLFIGVLPIIYDLESDMYPDPIMVDSFLQLPDSLSTAPHGFKFEGLYVGDFASVFSLRDNVYEADAEWIFNIDFDFEIDDKLVFSSINFHKTVYVERSSVVTFLVDKIESVSTWPIIFPGANSIYSNHHFDEAFIFTRVEYYPAYWGV